MNSIWNKVLMGGASAILLAGCFTAELDPSLSAVFVCEDNEDCSGNQQCVLQRCVSEEDFPSVEILDPQENIAIDDVEGALRIELQTSLELQERDARKMFGAGFIEVNVKARTLPGQLGQQLVNATEIVESEDELVLEVLPERILPAPVRITVQAFIAEGEPYPNPEAKVTKLVFIDDGTPQVAISAPWPGDRITASDTDIPFAIQVVNFDLMPPDVNNVVQGQGHGHVYRLEPDQAGIPEMCLQGDGCPDASNLYLLVAPTPSQVPTDELTIDLPLQEFPSAMESTQVLGLTLQQSDHTLFTIPSGGGGPVENRPVFDAVVIDRVPGL